MSKKSAQNAATDPLVWALVLLYRRVWLLALAGVIVALPVYFLQGKHPESYRATAQLYIKLRPVIAGGLQDPINAVAYRDLLQSDRMHEAAEGATSLAVNVEVTQDTNFGKYYSPVLGLSLTASDAATAESAMVKWREAFLAAYGDLATSTARDSATRLEKQRGKLLDDLGAARRAELQQEALLRPLLLERADLERLIAPFTLEIPNVLPERPRAAVQTRDRVIFQDVNLNGEAPPPPQLEPIEGAAEIPLGPAAFKLVNEDTEKKTTDPQLLKPDQVARLSGSTKEALAALNAEVAELTVSFETARRERVRIEGGLAELENQIELNRLLAAAAVGGFEERKGPDGESLQAFEAADVVWLSGASEPRQITSDISLLVVVIAGATGAIAMAILLLLSSLSRQMKS
jgi:hypothetical protein